MGLSSDTRSKRKIAFGFMFVLFALMLLSHAANAQGRTSLRVLMDKWDEFGKELKGITPTDQVSCSGGVEVLGVRSDSMGGVYKLSGDNPFLTAYHAARNAELKPAADYSEAYENASRLEGRVKSIEKRMAEAYECVFNFSSLKNPSAEAQRRLSECRAEAAKLESELPGAKAQLRQAEETRDRRLKELLPFRANREALYQQCEQEAAKCP